MSKAYACDACGVAMTDPYEARMREFYVGVTFDCGQAFPCNAKTRKRKVHLCGDCYNTLQKRTDKKEEDNND